MEAPTLDRRLVAILAADVEGYSRLMALDEEAALATLSAHRAIADELIVAFRGRMRDSALVDCSGIWARTPPWRSSPAYARRRSPSSLSCKSDPP
jgi:hypothetical protein